MDCRALEQQERAISIKKQQHEIQTANLESVATEIRDILGKSSDVKQENEQEDTASKSEESVKDKEVKGDYVVEITKDLMLSVVLSYKSLDGMSSKEGLHERRWYFERWTEKTH